MSAARFFLCLDILLNQVQRCAATANCEIGRTPQRTFPESRLKVGTGLAQHSARNTFQAIHEPRQGYCRRIGHEQVHVVILAIHFSKLSTKITAYVGHAVSQHQKRSAVQHMTSILCHKDQVYVKCCNAVSAAPYILIVIHRPSILIT